MQIVDRRLAVEIDSIDDRNIFVGDNGQVTFVNGRPTEVTTLDHRFNTDPLPESDLILGGAGHDIIIGGNSGDNLVGNGGDDLILGDNAKVTLAYPSVLSPGVIVNIELLDCETGGPDVIEGGAGDDVMYGQFDDDRYVFSGLDLGNDQVIEEGDNEDCPNDLRDTLDFTNFGAPVIVDLWQPYEQIIALDQLHLTLHNATAFEDVIGSAFADEIQGNTRMNHLDGRVGNDTLWGFAANDTLIGGTGDDVAFGGTGNDLITGDADDDVFAG